MNMSTFPNTLDAYEHEFDVLTAEKTGGLLQLANYPKNMIFAVCRNESDEYVGNVGIFGVTWIHRVAELRVIIGDKRHWGQGIASEAYGLVASYAFDRLNMRRLWAGAREDNVGSIRALEKIGFVREGAFRQNVLRNERAYDTVLLGLLRGELKTPAAGRR
jgi:RimJ/RimL family protein N-acetyltransferase